MLLFKDLSLQQFLTHYWQKKPLLIRCALPHFINPLSPEELAGLALEEDVESRLVVQDLKKPPHWNLKRGPFTEEDFKDLPPSHWTLLVQGVDRLIPEVASLLNDFNFIPQWRIDDIMISYAAEQGSVGPHFDYYDVFLYQAKGRRKWLLTTSDCTEENYLPGLELRIMKEFKVEQEYILEEGDMLYLPSKVGHHGISMSDDCMTYSIGYRSYKDQELWDSFGEYLFCKKREVSYYEDPSWLHLKDSAEIPQEAWLKAKSLMQAMLENDSCIQDWFGTFATQLDSQAASQLSLDSEEDELGSCEEFLQVLTDSQGLIRNPLGRIAYYASEDHLSLYINGEKHCVEKVSEALVKLVANKRTVFLEEMQPFLNSSENQPFLYTLWKLGLLEFLSEDN